MTPWIRIHTEPQNALRLVVEERKQRHMWRLVGIHVENKVVWEKKGESGQCSEERLGGLEPACSPSTRSQPKFSQIQLRNDSTDIAKTEQLLLFAF